MGETRFAIPQDLTDDEFGLVIAGGGISGLSAALLYQQRAGRDRKILILDNHDDFGGHAKRNEFTVDGQLLLCHGGGQTISSPASYSPVSAKVLKDIGIDTDPFDEYFDQDYFSSRNLGTDLYFGSEQYGKDVLCPNIFGGYSGEDNLDNLVFDVATYPISDETKAALIRLMTSETDYLGGKSHAEKLDIHKVVCAQPSLMHSFGMDFPVSMGGYDYTSESGQPTVLHGTWCPAVPDQGLSNIEQHKQGRRDLFAMSFDDFEDKIVPQLSGALSGGGFDPGRDIAGITVNRWPHGYAYEYTELYDDPSFGPDKGPHLVARKQIGRISIANSDANAYAYVDGAIDAADRAVNEQLTA